LNLKNETQNDRDQLIKRKLVLPLASPSSLTVGLRRFGTGSRDALRCWSLAAPTVFASANGLLGSREASWPLPNDVKHGWHVLRVGPGSSGLARRLESTAPARCYRHAGVAVATGASQRGVFHKQIAKRCGCVAASVVGVAGSNHREIQILLYAATGWCKRPNAVIPFGRAPLP